MKLIFDGKRWELHKATAGRLIFHPANNDGKLLAKWRKQNKLNQRTAAQRFGVSQTHLAKIELGSRSCPPSILSRIHEV